MDAVDADRLRAVLQARQQLLPAVERLRRGPPDPAENRRVFGALLREAVAVGALPLRDPLAGIETDVELAAALNGLRTAP